jgi:hypothetical protein
MCVHTFAGSGTLRFLRALPPVSPNEGSKIEVGCTTLDLIALHDDGRCVTRHGVDEGLAIGEDAASHVLE